MTSLLPVYERDLVIVSGKGARLTDSAGNTYLDFAAGVGVNGLGYGNTQGAWRAIRKQAGRMIHASNLYFNEPGDRAGRRGSSPSSFPAQASSSELGDGERRGGDQVRAPHRPRRRAHGAGGLRGLLPRPHDGRALHHLEGEVPRALRAARARRALLPLERPQGRGRAIIGPKTAGVFIEPVQGEGGVRVAPADFLHGLADICREAGALLVSEEVQCGLGRTGAMFAYQHAHIRPGHRHPGQAARRRAAPGRGAPARGARGRHRASAITAARSAATRWPRPPRWWSSTASPPTASWTRSRRRARTCCAAPARAAAASYPEQIRDVRGARPHGRASSSRARRRRS